MARSATGRRSHAARRTRCFAGLGAPCHARAAYSSRRRRLPDRAGNRLQLGWVWHFAEYCGFFAHRHGTCLNRRMESSMESRSELRSEENAGAVGDRPARPEVDSLLARAGTRPPSNEVRASLAAIQAARDGRGAAVAARFASRAGADHGDPRGGRCRNLRAGGAPACATSRGGRGARGGGAGDGGATGGPGAARGRLRG